MEIVVHSFVTNRLDFCNGILAGINKELIAKIQRVQNAAARIVSNCARTDHITPILKSLHWLPITKRIDFKILVLVYKCLHSMAPSYLKDLLQIAVPTRPLRSSHHCHLVIPKSNLKCSTQAFSIIGPILWNSLPFYIQCSPNLNIFKARLKTHLFKSYFT